MIFENLLSCYLAFDPSDCGTGRIPVEGDLAASRRRARVIAANVPQSAQLQSYPCVKSGESPEYAFTEIAAGVFAHKSAYASGSNTGNLGDISNLAFIIGK